MTARTIYISCSSRGPASTKLVFTRFLHIRCHVAGRFSILIGSRENFIKIFLTIMTASTIYPAQPRSRFHKISVYISAVMLLVDFQYRLVPERTFFSYDHDNTYFIYCSTPGSNSTKQFFLGTVFSLPCC